MSLASTAALVGGAWSPGLNPSMIWRGDMTDADYGKAPIQLELYGGDDGILRTVYGWFPVSDFAATTTGFSFTLNGSQETPPNATDERIIELAATILWSASVWNRADNRICPESERTLSIYCAVEKAVEVITGGTGALVHRRPAMEVIRGLVDDRTAGRGYEHRLMDYNNDPRTTFADVQSLFVDALREMRSAQWLNAHGFVTPVAP